MRDGIANAMREMIVRHESSIQNKEKMQGVGLLEETMANTVTKMLSNSSRKKEFNSPSTSYWLGTSPSYWLGRNRFRIL